MIIDTIGSAVTSIQVDGSPFYSYGTWIDEANRLTLLNDIIAKQDQKFPLVFLLLDFTEDYIESENSYESDLSIFILGRTKDVNNAQRRHENEMPTLRAIESSLLTALKNYNIRFTDYSRTEMFYMKNQLSVPANSIELEIPAIYQIQCLT